MKAVVYNAPGSFTVTEVPTPDPKPGEVRVRMRQTRINSFPAAIAVLGTGRAHTDGLITHRFALDDYADALDALRGDRTFHKIIIECWSR